MTSENKRPDSPNGRQSTILRAIAARAIVYGLLVLGAIVYAVGLRAFVPTRGAGRPSRATTAQPQSRDESTDRGWPNWRGPNYDAHSADTDLADSWPKEGPPVLWSREIGQGYSSVIAVGARVFTQTQSLTEQTVIALDADTGASVWEHRYGWPYDPGGMYPGPRATPSWSDGKLYLAAPDGLISCLDAADGNEIWSVNVNQKYGGRGTEFGYSCSPLIEDGKVILPVGGEFHSVVALDAGTGEKVWKSGSAVASYATALPICFKGHRQVVVFLQNELAGFDLQTGILLWERRYSTGYDEHAAAPLYSEPYLRTMQPFRGGSDLLILQRLDEAANGREGEAPAEPINSTRDASPPHDPLPPEDHECRLRLVRTDKQMSNDVASSVLVDGYVYGFDLREIQSRRQRPSRGEFRCMDFLTGEIRWSDKTIGQATIAVADRKLYLFNDRGEAILLRVNPERCEELARAAVFPGEICWTAPCLHRGRLYLRSPTKLACLYVGKPEDLDRAARREAKPTSAIPKDKWVDLNWLLGAERDAPFDLPDGKELLRWFWYCLGAIFASAILAASLYGIVKIRFRESADGFGRMAFCLGMLCFGIIATPLCNRFSSHFVFTWPVALFAAQQIALLGLCRSNRNAAGGRSWHGIIYTVFFVFLCLLYYDLTRRLCLGAAWYFLPTFLAAWPLAVPATRKKLPPKNFWADLLWLPPAFAIFYWASAGLMLWRATH
jgi:outer membrane protein assembly factor BamB